MHRLPKRGAYAVSLNHELAAVLGYDLDLKEAYLHKLKDVLLPDAEDFVNMVRRGGLPDIPPEQTIILETWALYGLPSGDIEVVTKDCWKKLEESLALKIEPDRILRPVPEKHAGE